MVQNAQDPCKLEEFGWNSVDTGRRPEPERKFDAVYRNCVQADWRTTMFPLLCEMRHAFNIQDGPRNDVFGKRKLQGRIVDL